MGIEVISPILGYLTAFTHVTVWTIWNETIFLWKRIFK